MKLKKILLSSFMGLFAVTVGTVGVALAAIPDSAGVIHACRLNLTGVMRVIDSPSASCIIGETSLNWSQTGLAAHMVTGTSDTVATDSDSNITDPHTVDLTATCPTSEYALQGFLAISGTSNFNLLFASGKTGASVGSSGWVVPDGDSYEVGTPTGAYNASGTITASVLCIPVPGLPS